MDTSHEPPPAADGFPGPLTAEKVRRFRTQVAAVHDHLRARGVDPTRLPDPVEELIKARDEASKPPALSYASSTAHDSDISSRKSGFR